MKLLLTFLFAVAVSAPVAVAQTADSPGTQAPAAASKPADMVEGEVRRIDKPANKVTLRHGPIPDLDMPPMTMVFQVRDPEQLEGLKVGDKVRFRAEKLSQGYVVTEISGP